ncbi:MAG: sulfite exporter TauE/SafE family protein [Polyangiaceae bacterium]
MSFTDVLLLAIVTVAFATETAIGFGATLIAVSLGSFLRPIDELLYAFVPLNVALSAAVVLRARGHIDGRLLGRQVLPAMALGLPIGLFAFARLPIRISKTALGVFVLGLAALEIVKMVRAREERKEEPLPRPLAIAMLVLGGVVHGAFATGGPPVVYVCGRLVRDKRVFRATLSTLWLVLGLVLLAVYAQGGHLGTGSLRLSALLAPGLVLGLILGEIAHGRIPERAFRATVFVMLAAVGATLAIRA